MQHMNKLMSGSNNSNNIGRIGLPIPINRLVHEQIYLKSFHDTFI